MCMDHFGENKEQCSTKAAGKTCGAAAAMMMMKQILENANSAGALKDEDKLVVLNETKQVLVARKHSA